MEAISAIKALVLLVFPRMEPFETGNFYGWRIYIAALALFTAGAVAMNYALAFGIITLFGFSGFASASEVSDIKQSQTRLEIAMEIKGNAIMGIVVGGQIFELRTKQCAARKAGNTEADVAYGSELSSQLDAYRGIMHHQYSLQDCP